MVPISQLYVAILFAADNGNTAFRLPDSVLQSIDSPNSTRLPASPADSRTVCTNFEPSPSRETSTATRTGPFSTTRIFAGPPTYERGGACSWSKSMFQAGHCFGASYEIASRMGAESKSLPTDLSKMLVTSPSVLIETR